MNPISQKLLGIGAVIGFTATFLVGSPEEFDVFGLVLRSILGGVIFGFAGYFIGMLLDRFLKEKLDARIKAYLLDRELRRQRRREAAGRTLSSMGASEEEEEPVNLLEPDMPEIGTIEGNV